MARPRMTGHRELLRALRAIPVETARNIDPAIKASMEPIRKGAEERARLLRQAGKTPPGGHLDQGTITQKQEQRGAHYRVWWVSLRNRARKIGHLVEFGTAPHYQPRRKMMHPGARPKPFMGPSFEQNKRQVIATLSNLTWGVISSAVTRYAKRGRR